MSLPRFIPAITWFLLSLVLLCLPGSSIPKYPWLASIHADKWVHIAMFAILCYLWSYPFAKSSLPEKKKKNWFLLILVSSISYGIMMEFVQKYWIPNRSFEFGDIMADGLGSLLAYSYCRKKFLHEGLLKKIGPDGNRDRNQN